LSSIMFFILTMFLILSSGVLIMFGTSVPSIASQLQGPIDCDINNIPQTTCQFAQYNPPTPANVTVVLNQTPWWKCIFSVPCVIASTVGTVAGSSNAQAIWNGMSEIAYAMGYYATFAYVFFNKAVQAIFLIYGITTLMSTDYGIPLLQYFWLAFFVFYIMYGLSMLKPGGSGL
jgi:hypothetical protein